MYKIIGADGREYGPITADQLRQWMAEGRANANTQVLPDGATEWRRLGDLPEFAAAAPPGPPPLTPLTPLAGPSSAAADEVNGPAIGLIVVAVLGFLAQVASLLSNVAGASILASRQFQGEPWMAMFSGTVAIITSIIGILVSGLLLFGAIKMKKLENYGLAMACSIIALIPCISPCCLVGLPIGIWAIVVLMKPEVKAAFH